MRFYRFLNIYSVDVVLGSLVCSLLFAKILKVEVPVATSLVLGLTVWLIYTFDHLKDAQNVSSPVTRRHLAHKVHFKPILLACITALLVISIAIFQMPVKTVVWGASLFAIVLAYFLLLNYFGLRFSYFKEVSISLIYSLGILIGPLSIYSAKLEPRHFLLILLFVLLAFTNLSVFSLFEFEQDQAQQFPSLTQVLGKENSKILLKVLLVVELIIIGLLYYLKTPFWILLTFSIMSFTLYLIYFFHNFFYKHERYRLVGDAVFFIPLLPLFTNG